MCFENLFGILIGCVFVGGLIKISDNNIIV